MTGGINHIGFGPPEVLDMIFSYCYFEDIKSIRLVSKHWKGASTPQIAKRIRLKLKRDINDVTDASSEQNIQPVKFGDFKNFSVIEHVPKTVENLLPKTLVSLYIKKVTFTGLNDVRRILFKAFPSLREISLIGIQLRRNSNQETPECITYYDIPKVRKIEVNQLCVSRELDIFQSWNLNEMITNFASTLDDLCIWQETRGVSNYQNNLFEDLKANNVHLRHLSYGSELDRSMMDSFMSYVFTCGERLQSLVINLGTENDFNRLFDANGHVLNSLKYISIQDQCWSHWTGGNLPNLKHLFQNQSQLITFEYMDQMPNLNTLDLMVTRCGCDFEHVPYRNSNIYTLRLDWYTALGISTYGQLFPNVTKLCIGGNPGMCGGCVRLEVLPILSPLCEAWPDLMDLELTGRWDIYIGSSRRKSQLGMVDINELQCLTSLKRLRSFVNNDHESSDIVWGDEVAVRVFLRMPSLRTVRIGSCRMSPEIINQLREKLMVFTFQGLL